MKREYGAFFLLALVGLAAWWYGSHHRKNLAVMGTATGESEPPNIGTTNAGGIIPNWAFSIVPTDGSDWGNVPYYLRSNYPDDRNIGSPVVPNQTVAPVVPSFGMQDLNPQL